MQETRRLPWAALIVGAAILLGGALRLYQVSERSMTHPEMYVPNIPLRADLSEPRPRMDLWTVITTTLSNDTHPPGFYVFMWFITKAFGTSTLAMRLPLVIFGTASIGLIFWLGSLIGQRAAGCVAALLLAFHGYHILWSKTTRMYSMSCFLGLLTTCLLIVLAGNTRRRKLFEFLYCALMLVGLACHYFFWALLAVHMVWVLFNAWNQERPMPRLLNYQILVMILGSPLFAFAAYQSGNQVAFLSRDVLLNAREFIQFAWLIPGWDDTWASDGTAGLLLPQQFMIFWVLFIIFCTCLLIVGITRLGSLDDPLLNDSAKPFAGRWVLAAVLATLVIAAHIFVAIHHGGVRPTLKVVKAMTVLPSITAIGAIGLGQAWNHIMAIARRVNLEFFAGSRRLVLLLTVVPFFMLAIASLVLRPLMEPRGFLFVSPYLLLTLACGIVALGKRSRWIAVSLAVVLVGLHGFSVAAYANKIVSPVNYAGFAAKLEPQIRSNDLVFLHRDWYTAPILYYMRPNKYQLHANDFAGAVQRNPNARVWVMLFRGETPETGITQALQGYSQVETVEFPQARGILYCKNGCQ